VDIKENDHAGGNSNGQSEDVNERKTFMFQEVSPCNLQVVLDHKRFLCEEWKDGRGIAIFTIKYG
jgi:hypothetical protein